MNTDFLARLDPLLTTFAQWRRAFDALARRERLLLIGAAVAAICMLADLVWLTPAFKEWSAAQAHQRVAAAAVASLNNSIVLGSDAEQLLRGEVAQWRQRVATGDRDLQTLRASLVGASDMVPLLDGLLAEAGGLHLRSMRSLEPTEVPTAAAGVTPIVAAVVGAVAPSGLYRHGIDLEVEGSYADVLAYLRAIETMPHRVLWGGLQLKVERYPKVVMSLRLYTVSEDRKWLEI